MKLTVGGTALYSSVKMIFNWKTPPNRCKIAKQLIDLNTGETTYIQIDRFLLLIINLYILSTLHS